MFTVTRERLSLAPLDSPDHAIPDDIDRARARQVVLAVLTERPRSYGELGKLVAGLSPRSELIVQCGPAYEVLWDLQHEGLLHCRTMRVKGADPALSAPKFVFECAM